MNFEKEKLETIMKELLDEVDIAIKEGNSPFAAFLIDDNYNILYRAHNTAKSEFNPTAHAEINLISTACKDLKTRDLSKYCIISNAWSCSMCMSACIKAKIKNYVYGAPSESDMNPNITIFDIKEKTLGELNIVTGISEDECKLQIEKARKKV